MRRGIFRRRHIGFRGRPMGRLMRGFRRPYRRFWGRPYRSFMWWRPFLWYPIWWRPLYWMPWTMMMGGFMYLLYDSMAYKLYRDDMYRIEQETGKSAKDINEEELLTAMKRLGIQKLEITPEDRETISKSKRPFRELNKEEILASMKRLGIKKLEVDLENQQANTKLNKFCIYCGNALQTNGIYCSRCGRKRVSK